MKQVLFARGDASVRSSVEALVARHGAWRVLGQAVRALLVRRYPPPNVDVLNDRLLRDIGLPPQRQAPRYWHDLR